MILSLVISQVVSWLVIAGLVVALLALARQVGSCTCGWRWRAR
jgi:hypothetical protein